MSTAIKLRGDSTANWTSNNPVLLDREIAVDTTLNRFKIGNGTSKWSQLNFMDKSLEDALGLKAPSANPAGGANNYAPIANPKFTGNVSISMPGLGYSFEIDGDDGDVVLNSDTGLAYSNSALSLSDNSARIATTAFVQAQKNNPTFTGEPKSVTPTGSSDAKMIATKEYVDNLVLNGTNYLMVYGTGTPTYNADELQAAYNEAKKMPRFLGFLNPTTPKYMYAGQTFGIYIDGFIYHKVLVDGQYLPLQMSGPITVTPEEAKSVRTTIIVAPGKYDFGATAFVADKSGIDIVSLTGNLDVMLDGIAVTANNVYLKGLNCGNNNFYVVDATTSNIYENCKGNVLVENSDLYGKFINFNFTLSALFDTISANCELINCYGYISPNNEIAGKLISCILVSGVYAGVVGAGKIYNCIDGDGNVINSVHITVPNGTAASHAVNKSQLDAAALNSATIEYVIAANNSAGTSNATPANKHFGIYTFTANTDFDISLAACPIGSIVIIKTIGNFTVNISASGAFTLDGQDIDVSLTGAVYPIVNTFIRTLYKNTNSTWVIIG